MKKIAALFTAVVMIGLILTGCSADSKKAKVIDIKLTDEEYAFGVDKNQSDLLSKVNEFIAQIKADGTFDEICDRHFKGGTPKEITSAALDTSKDQLVVATNAAFEPFEYMKGDKYCGIDMEIAEKLAQFLGKELVISNLDFDAVCLSVSQGKADIAMAGLTITDERKEYVTFSEKYYNASQKVIARKSDKTFDNCKTAEDVEKVLKGLKKGTKVGVQAGTTAQYYVEGDEDWGFEGFENLKVSGYKSGSLAVQDMINGNIDYVVIDEAPAIRIVESINDMA
jgi:polar amino acid transport system substrate-binding protein